MLLLQEVRRGGQEEAVEFHEGSWDTCTMKRVLLPEQTSLAFQLPRVWIFLLTVIMQM